jgi:hypothetical protein
MQIARLGLLVVLLAGIGLARTATPPPPGQRIYDTKWMNINRWLCPFYNDGKYGIDNSAGGDAGGSWPQPFKNCYIFGAGLWFGSLKPNANDTSKVDTLVTFGYNPNSGGTEMTPTITAFGDQGAGSTDDKVYVYPGDWQIPRQRWLDAYPGDTMIDKLVPKENFSLQDMWCAYSDVLPENHISPGKPQGIDIFQTVYAWNYPTNQDIFFIIYYVRNSGTDTLKHCYMGAVMDADVGAAGDDMVGLLDSTFVPGAGLVQNVGYVGDNDNRENAGATWEEGTPGVFAYKFLASPADTSGRELGMTAFKKFTIDIDPVTDPAQYLTMAGYDYRTGVFSPYDSVDLAPADKRFIQCSGPFDLVPGQVERLIVAAIGAPFGGPGQTWNNRPIDSLVHLANTANSAQFIFDQGWLLPSPPSAPNVTLVPGDNQVRIVWDNLPEVTADPYWERVVGDSTSPNYDPNYIGYDFQGYQLMKSRDGAEWTTLAQWDKVDTFPRGGTDSVFEFAPAGDTAHQIEMRNSGLRYSFTDNDVTNGFNYYYCVLAYDWNRTTRYDSLGNPDGFDTLILRSGFISNDSVVPRWEAVNYIMPSATLVTEVGDVTGPDTLGLRLTPEVAAPFLVTADTCRLTFGAPEYAGSSTGSTYRYNMVNTATGETAFTGVQAYDVNTELEFFMPVFNGLALTCSMRVIGPTNAFDTVFVTSPTYPSSRVQQSGATSVAFWAFRGSSYEIRWSTTPYLTVQVLDVTHNNVPVAFAAFDGRSVTQDQANGWCFVDRAGRNPSDTCKATSARLYICGGYIALNATPTGDSAIGSLTSSITNGDVWLANGEVGFGTAPYYNQYLVVPTPGITDAGRAYKLNVMVVPNPYIIFNGWEASTEQRVVRFTNLPGECTIRIYTTSGDLVKILHHRDRGTHPGAQPLELGGTETWDFTNESPGAGAGSSGQLIAAGVYVWHVESAVGEQVGKLVFIH